MMAASQSGLLGPRLDYWVHTEVLTIVVVITRRVKYYSSLVEYTEVRDTISRTYFLSFIYGLGRALGIGYI